MIKDTQMKPNITTEKCKSCSDVVFRSCDVYSEIKLFGKRKERHIKGGRNLVEEKREREMMRQDRHKQVEGRERKHNKEKRKAQKN